MEQDNTLQKLDTVLSHPDLLQDQKDAIYTLKTTYLELSNYLARESWVKRVKTVQAEANFLVSIVANTAMFLAFIQGIAIAYIATVAPIAKADQNHPSLVRAIIDILSYCGLMFDMFGVLFAMITSWTLFLKASEASTFTIKKQELCDEIATALNLTFTDFPEQHSKSTTLSPFTTVHEKLQKYHRKAKELADLMDNHLRVGYMEVIAVIIAGAVSLFASFALFIIDTQPLQVWLSIFMIISVVGVAAGMLSYMQSRRHPGIGRTVL